MSEILVSIIMPTYNSSKTIERSIDSVLNQNFANFELIVVDDCSTDYTVPILRGVESTDDRVRLIVCDSNSGSPARPRNIGIQSARGRYICFLDSDDVWHRDKLRLQVAFMAVNDSAISCTAYDVVNVDGDIVGSFYPPTVVDYRDLLAENTLGCLTVIVDRQKIKDLEFPECGHEDYALWLSITRNGWPVDSLNLVLASYTLTPGSISSNKFKVLGYFWNIYRCNEGFSIVKSFFYCIRYAWNTKRKYSLGYGK
jgi:teichuronic acid biosynthesis glycosyltransferase TuaG